MLYNGHKNKRKKRKHQIVGLNEISCFKIGENFERARILSMLNAALFFQLRQKVIFMKSLCTNGMPFRSPSFNSLFSIKNETFVQKLCNFYKKNPLLIYFYDEKFFNQRIVKKKKIYMLLIIE